MGSDDVGPADVVDPWQMCKDEFKMKLKEFNEWLHGTANSLKVDVGVESGLPHIFLDGTPKQAWARHEVRIFLTFELVLTTNLISKKKRS
jgi:hypothetical protein